ncbi:MAG: ABC transporter permease [Bacillota bacterium]
MNLKIVTKFIKKEPLAFIASLIVLLYIITALFAPLIVTHDPFSTKTSMTVEGEKLYAPFPPNEKHWFGTDQLGRDLFSRIIYGVRISLFVGIVARGLSLLVGVLIGLISGFSGGLLDNIMMRTTDVFMSIPAILLAMIVTLIFSPSLTSVIWAIVIVGWPEVARLVRSQVMNIKNNDYVKAVEVLGAKKTRIILKHILPNCLGVIIVSFSMGIPGAVMYEAGLSFFGLGIQPPAPSLGSIISNGRGYMMFAPWYSILPGVVLALFVLAVNILGDTVIDYFDPSYK